MSENDKRNWIAGERNTASEERNRLRSRISDLQNLEYTGEKIGLYKN